MTRNDMSRGAQTRPAASFTPMARPQQQSAWARGALQGGSIGLMALVLALGFSVLRPRPRRRPPEVPAPAHSRVWQRRR